MFASTYQRPNHTTSRQRCLLATAGFAIALNYAVSNFTRRPQLYIAQQLSPAIHSAYHSIPCLGIIIIPPLILILHLPYGHHRPKDSYHTSHVSIHCIISRPSYLCIYSSASFISPTYITSTVIYNTRT